MAGRTVTPAALIDKAVELLTTGGKTWIRGSFARTADGKELSYRASYGGNATPLLHSGGESRWNERARRYIRTNEINAAGAQAEKVVDELCSVGAIQVAAVVLGADNTITEKAIDILAKAVVAKPGDSFKVDFENAFQVLIDDGGYDDIPDAYFKQFLKPGLRVERQKQLIEWLRGGLIETWNDYPKAEEVLKVISRKEAEKIIESWGGGGEDSQEQVINHNDSDARDFKTDILPVFKKAQKLARK